MNLPFTLIICTYMRPESLMRLLNSVDRQTLYPNEIIIVDGSTNLETEDICKKSTFKNLRYFKVDNNYRGLTKQRNFGLDKMSKTSEIVCFLDDDTVLDGNYFKTLIKTYIDKEDALGVGGYITNDVCWEQVDVGHRIAKNEFYYDGFKRLDGKRFLLRKQLGLLDDSPPGIMPKSSHGRPVSFLPPSGKIYPVEMFMGGVSSFKTSILKHVKFSEYFIGYGLYEDADFCLRLSKIGQLYVNTGAMLSHFHDPLGRPNMYAYGKMVLRNGWYVWRVKFPSPSLKSKIKWHGTSLLLTLLRGLNVVTTNNKKEAAMETIGRFVGWVSLLFEKPKFNNTPD